MPREDPVTKTLLELIALKFSRSIRSECGGARLHVMGTPGRWLQSYSGVRAKIGPGSKVLLEDELFAFRHAYCYAVSRLQANPAPEARIVLARDPRPTGEQLLDAQAEGIACAFRDLGVRLDLINLGIVSTPVWQHAVRQFQAHGGAMITASHNPLDNNGWKYATGIETVAVDPAPPGALLSAAEMGLLIRAANAFSPTPRDEPSVPDERPDAREDAIHRYVEFIAEHYNTDVHNVKVVLDPNGGAACGIASRVFERLGVTPVVLNDEPGQPGHVIDVESTLPDGSHVLEPLAARVREEGALFGLAYDFDADRGNLTYVDRAGKAAIPSPQMAAAINVAIALSLHRRAGDTRPPAVVASDATSYRVHAIADHFGAEVHEVETGEINVVTKMRDLDALGYRTVVGVEGPNGGTIFAGTTCRDGSLVGAGALLACADDGLRAIAAEALKGQLGTGLIGFVDLLPTQRTLAAKGEAPGDWEEVVDRLEARFPELFVRFLARDWGMFTFHYSYTRYVGRDRPRGKSYGWKVRLESPKGRGFLWIRGSKTERGVVRVVADAPTLVQAEALLSLGQNLLATD